MVTFTPASDVWTLGYDQFDGVCWRHNKTQELYYIPPAQPLVLPPRSLAFVPRSNLPNDPRFSPAATVGAEAYSQRGVGGGVHFNYNSASNVPGDARVWPVSSVEGINPHPSPPMWKAEEANQWLHPRSLANVPRPDLPNDPHCIPAATTHAGAFPLQGVGEGEHSNNNSTLMIPETARAPSPPVVEDTEPRLSPPMSRAKDAKRGLPQRSLANVPCPNLPNDPHSTPAATTRSEAFPLQGVGEGKHVNNGYAMVTPETAQGRPPSVVEDTKPRLSPPMSRAKEAKHGLHPGSLANVPRPDFPNDPHLIPTTTTRAGVFPLREDGEGGHFNDYAPKVPEASKVQQPPFIEDTKPHPSPLMSRPEEANQWLHPNGLTNVPRPNLPSDPHRIPAATTCAEAFPLREDGEGMQFDDNSALNLPEGVRVRPASAVKDTKPRTSPMSREEEEKQWSRVCDNQGNEYYFNSVTGESHPEKPDCLKKYTCRR